jgi:ectoine hydroxylase
MKTTFNLAGDLYPSRYCEQEQVMTRLDPVVYSCLNDAFGADIPSSVTLQQIDFFENNGFLLLDAVFSDKEVTLMQQEVQRLRNDPMLARRQEMASDPLDPDIVSIFDVQRFSPLLRNIMHDARLAGMARYLLGEGIYLHQSSLCFKPGFRARPFYWKSDFETWHVEDGMPRMQAISVSISLTDMFFSNGPTMLIPGSHRHFISCAGSARQENNLLPVGAGDKSGVPGDDIVHALVETGGIALAAGRAGSVLISDCNVLHGTAGNISPHARTDLRFVYNALSNCLLQPYGEQPPRPEYMAHRNRIETAGTAVDCRRLC